MATSVVLISGHCPVSLSSEVMHKERDKEKGKSPHTPLKEKETEKETFPNPYPKQRARTCAGTCAGTGAGTGAGACTRARVGASRSGSGAVDIRQWISGAGSIGAICRPESSPKTNHRVKPP